MDNNKRVVTGTVLLCDLIKIGACRNFVCVLLFFVPWQITWILRALVCSVQISLPGPLFPRSIHFRLVGKSHQPLRGRVFPLKPLLRFQAVLPFSGGCAKIGAPPALGLDVPACIFAGRGGIGFFYRGP